ncbi:MAG: hypothetical protein Fur0025_16140 [Oscillatoriaceae cyanobacterium]
MTGKLIIYPNTQKAYLGLASARKGNIQKLKAYCMMLPKLLLAEVGRKNFTPNCFQCPELMAGAELTPVMQPSTFYILS